MTVLRAIVQRGLVERRRAALVILFLVGFALGTLTGWPVSVPFTWSP
jgi:hypothetical protein